MYRPNFCAECGHKTLRVYWHPWTSRRFCDSCSRRLRKIRLKRPIVTTLCLLSLGFVAGRISRPKPPPLIIQRAPIQPTPEQSLGVKPLTVTEEQIYICGARTKKGTPCSRRVSAEVRCWQHKGERAMLPREKLVIKE
ncbi:MAG TPA: hypothetical protein VIB00_10335 [Pyrinomonadaceae bacterium]